MQEARASEEARWLPLAPHPGTGDSSRHSHGPHFRFILHERQGAGHLAAAVLTLTSHHSIGDRDRHRYSGVTGAFPEFPPN